jgi:hypothetical protein
MSNELEIVERFDLMNKVVEEMLKGNNPTQIAKTLSIKRGDVLVLMDEWRGFAHSDNRIRERAKEALSGADQHYNMLISRAWETVEQADDNAQYNVKAQVLKLITDIEGKRIEMLQKAGLLENNELANDLIEAERKQEILMSILREVTSDCDHCKVEVARRLGKITNRVEEIIVED